MIICGQEFAFSAPSTPTTWSGWRRRGSTSRQPPRLSAKRYTEECVSYPGILRSQCRMMMSSLDEATWAKVSSERLHLDGGDFGAVLKVCESFRAGHCRRESRHQRPALRIFGAAPQPCRTPCSSPGRLRSGGGRPPAARRPAHGAARSDCRAGQGSTAAGDGDSLHPGGRKADAQLRGIL